MYVILNKNNFMKSEILQKTVSLLVKTEAPKGWNYLQKHGLLLFKDKHSLSISVFFSCQIAKEVKMEKKTKSASGTQMDLVLLLLKSLKGDLISSLNQTVLLSSLAEKITL